MLADRARMGSNKRESFGEPYLYHYGKFENMWSPGYTTGDFTYSKQPEYLEMYTKSKDASFAWETINPVVLTGITSIEYDILNLKGTYPTSYVSSLNVSSLTGTYYIRVQFNTVDSGMGLSVAAYLRVSKNRLDPPSTYTLQSEKLNTNTNYASITLQINSIMLI